MKTTLHGNENTDYTAVRENASFRVIFCSVLISVYSMKWITRLLVMAVVI